MNDSARLTAHWVSTTDAAGRPRVEMRWVRVSVPAGVDASTAVPRVAVPVGA